MHRILLIERQDAVLLWGFGEIWLFWSFLWGYYFHLAEIIH